MRSVVHRAIVIVATCAAVAGCGGGSHATAELPHEQLVDHLTLLDRSIAQLRAG